MRWAVLAVGLWALIRAVLGWLGGRAWSPPDRLAGMLFSIGVDNQLLIGLLLAFFSPLVRAAFTDPGAALRSAMLRFFVAEHIPAMVLAVPSERPLLRLFG